ncbi:hypothetical protein [Rhodococcus qingshengii]|uniref:Uncharacterized protein n=2 Tax=Nocardiaceae TaxID=85025 RepID=A0AB38RA33_RHOSG|nr:hypothetical protein [Rhodococcus qingshengii]QXC42202.1 hypothetical protein KSE96_24490 [Rhodococcus qingshengii]UPU42197.1 hypothetical protein M0639_24710 [Rhodococcus qingshengii JCM 15477]
MTDTELVEELNRLENLDELTRCDEIRLDIVRDELVRRQSKHRRAVNTASEQRQGSR